MALTLGTAESNSGCQGNFLVGTSLFTKKRYCHIAQRLRHIGGGFRRAKRARGTCKLPQDWWANLSLHHSATQLGICFLERGRDGAQKKTWALGWTRSNGAEASYSYSAVS